jgi:hypothetical protein
VNRRDHALHLSRSFAPPPHVAQTCFGDLRFVPNWQQKAADLKGGGPRYSLLGIRRLCGQVCAIRESGNPFADAPLLRCAKVSRNSRFADRRH